LELAAKRLAARDLAELRNAAGEWAGNTLSPNLSELGKVALEAIGYVESNRSASEKWISEKRQSLDAMEKPSGEVVLAAVRPVRLLLDAASRQAANSGGAPRNH
jgi:hypothetical protein